MKLYVAILLVILGAGGIYAGSYVVTNHLEGIPDWVGYAAFPTGIYLMGFGLTLVKEVIVKRRRLRESRNQPR